MRNIYNALLLLIAGATNRELARQVTYLKVENKILRGKLSGRVTVTAQERNRLVRFGAKLGKSLNQLVTIVHPDTLRRWIRESRKRRKVKVAKVGRRSRPLHRVRGTALEPSVLCVSRLLPPTPAAPVQGERIAGHKRQMPAETIACHDTAFRRALRAATGRPAQALLSQGSVSEPRFPNPATASWPANSKSINPTTLTCAFSARLSLSPASARALCQPASWPP